MRVNAIFAPTDFKPDGHVEQADIDEFFASTFPGVEHPHFDADHAGMAVAALNPDLARQLGAVSRFLILDAPFSQRTDLRELVIQTTHRLHGCEYGFRSRIGVAQRSGLSEDQLSVLPGTGPAGLFDEDQVLAIDFTCAVIGNEMTDDLFDRAKSRFSERAAIEMTTIAGFWSCWSMIVNTAMGTGSRDG